MLSQGEPSRRFDLHEEPARSTPHFEEIRMGSGKMAQSVTLLIKYSGIASRREVH